MITKEQFSTIEALYNYYNKELFDGVLNDCMLNMSRTNGSAGFFSPFRWKDKEGRKVHEISINPDTFNIDDQELHQTIVHEMVHLWQQDFGTPSRQCYHNKEWAAKMIEIGLMPSDTGKEGGKTTGQKMCDYAIDGGKFKDKFKAIQGGSQEIKLPFFPIHNFEVSLEDVIDEATEKKQKEKKNGVKFKFTCQCETNIWGKYDIEVMCMVCNTAFEREEKE